MCDIYVLRLAPKAGAHDSVLCLLGLPLAWVKVRAMQTLNDFALQFHNQIESHKYFDKLIRRTAICINRDILINDINKNHIMIDIAVKSERKMSRASLKRNVKSNIRSLFTLRNHSINSSKC